MSVAAVATGDVEALIREARRRARSRRARLFVGGCLVVGLVAAGWLVGPGGGDAVLAESSSRPFVNLSAFAHEGRLAFVSRGVLWVLGSKGALREVSPRAEQASDPAFSPNGRWLSYALSQGDSGVSRLWVAHANGWTHGSLPAARAVAAPIGFPTETCSPRARFAADRPRWERPAAGCGAGRADRVVFARRALCVSDNPALRAVSAGRRAGHLGRHFAPGDPRTRWLVTPKPSKRQGGTLFIDDGLVLPDADGIILRAPDVLLRLGRWP